MANPHFAEPDWLWLAVLGPIIVVALMRYSAVARRRQLAQIASAEALRQMAPGHSVGRRLLKEAMLVLSIAATGIALARPQWGEQADGGRLIGQDMVFILDCSRSMLAADLTPNRLLRAKLAIGDYVQNYARGRVALVAFAGQAFIQCPLTFDYSAFREALLAMDERTIPIPGTDIARALDEAMLATDKNDKQKIFVLLTDGEDLEKGGVQMAQTLAKKGVVIFTLGVGTPAGAEIEYINDQNQRVKVRDKKGEPVRSRLDEPALSAIAQATHGTYYSLGTVGEGLAKVHLAANALEPLSGSAPARRFGIDRFHLPVACLAVLLVAESLLGTRRRSRAPVISS